MVRVGNRTYFCFGTAKDRERFLISPSPPQTQKRPRRRRGLLRLVEVRGIEPLSENLLIQLSPGAEYLLLFLTSAPVLRLVRQAAVFCMIGSTANCRCMFTTLLTLSLGSWSYREERAVRRPRHCQLLSPEGSIIRQP